MLAQPTGLRDPESQLGECVMGAGAPRMIGR